MYIHDNSLFLFSGILYRVVLRCWSDKIMRFFSCGLHAASLLVKLSITINQE